MNKADLQNAPFFSIVVATYNRADLISRAVKSVLRQSFRDYELIVIDDCSIDDTEQVIKGFDDVRVRYFRTQKNGGVAFAQNRGLDIAAGRYVTFLGDDDEFLPDFLVEMKTHLEEKRSVFAWTAIEVCNAHGEFVVRSFSPVVANAPLGVRQAAVIKVGTGFGFTIERDFLERIGKFDESLRNGVDTEMFLRAVQQPVLWSSIDKTLVRIHKQNLRLTKSTMRRLRDVQSIVSRHLDFIDSRPIIKKGLYEELARLSSKNGERVLARRTLLNLIATEPRNFKYWRELLRNEIRHSRLIKALKSYLRTPLRLIRRRL